MKRLLFLFALIATTLASNAQTPVSGKYRYVFIIMDSVFAVPGDTLASAPVRSIAIKNDALYYKLTSGHWAGISGGGTVLAGNGLYKVGDSIKLGGTPLTEAVTLNLNGRNIFLTGVGNGTLSDSCMVLDAASNAIRKVAQNTVGAWALDGDNNLTPKSFSGNQISVTNKSFLLTGATGAIPTTAVGTHFYWYPAKRAVRVGQVFGTGTWSDANTGQYSFAGGEGVQATGFGTFAWGSANLANSSGAAVFGSGNQVTGQYGFATGSGNTITGGNAWAGGVVGNISADFGFSYGNGANVYGVHGYAFGANVNVRDSHAVAFGRGMIARNKYQFVHGRFNDTSSVSELFGLGWGRSNTTRYNVFSVDTLGRVKLDSVDDGSAGDPLVTYNRFNRTFNKVPLSTLYGSIPMSATQVAYGDAFNIQTSSPTLRYFADLRRLTTNRYQAGRYAQVGDTSYKAAASDTAVFFGNSITAGAIEPTYLRPPKRISNALNLVEWNFGIGGTRMVQLSTGDSAMIERVFLIPQYRPTLKYLFFCYGTNDWRTLSVDTAVYRSTYNKVIDTALLNRSWLGDSIVLVSPGYSISSNPAIQPRLDQFVAITKDIAQKKGVRFVDVKTAMVRDGGDGNLQADSVHLSEYGSENWAYTVLDTLKARNGGLRVNGTLFSRQQIMTQYANTTPAMLVMGSNGLKYFELKGNDGGGAFTVNLALGVQQLDSVTPAATNNLAIGQANLRRLRSGIGNIAIGNSALYNNLIGNYSIAIGLNALLNSTADRNLALGNFSLAANTTGTKNVAVGYAGLQANTTGGNLTALGDGAGQGNTTASNNVFIGANAGVATTTGGDNTFGGTNAGFGNIGGSSNTIYGYNAYFTGTAGVANSYFGKNAGKFSTGSLNTLHGFEAGTSMTTSSRNTFIGQGAGRLFNTGGNNTYGGYLSGDSNTTGIQNTGWGYQSAFNRQTGSNNLDLGFNSGLNQRFGDYNVNIGSYTWPANSTISNALSMADGQGNLWIGGNLTGVGIGTVSPTNKLHVAGDVRINTIANGALSADSLLVVNGGVVKKIAPIISASFSQVGAATTTFTVTIGTTQANSTYKVQVTPTAILSAALFYVTNKTTTTFDVVYLSGITGTVTFDWTVLP